MKLIVNAPITNQSDTVTLNVSPSDTIEHVKRELCQEVGYPIKLMTLTNKPSYYSEHPDELINKVQDGGLTVFEDKQTLEQLGLATDNSEVVMWLFWSLIKCGDINLDSAYPEMKDYDRRVQDILSVVQSAVQSAAQSRAQSRAQSTCPSEAVSDDEA